MTLHDGVPVPKVIDFGIAKATEGRLATLRAHWPGVNTVAFTPDGQRLAGGTGDAFD